VKPKCITNLKKNNMKTNLMLLMLSITLIFSACQKGKTDILPVVPDESFESLDEYFSAKSPTAANFTLIGEEGVDFTTSKGSKITIPANSFVDDNGELVEGDVNIEIKEIFERSEMMFSGAFPVSNDMLLNSGGMFDISANSSDGADLEIAAGAKIVVQIPAQAEDPEMQLFFAAPWGEDDPDGAAVNWQVVELDSILVEPLDSFEIIDGDTVWIGPGAGGGNWEPSGPGFTFASSSGTYEITLDSLGWANIDAFDWNVQYFDCTFNLKGEGLVLDDLNTTAFAVFTGQNAVWPVGVAGWGGISANTITDNHLASTPFNLVVISVVDNKLYSGILDVTPVAGEVYDVDMNETSSADLDEVIANLP